MQHSDTLRLALSSEGRFMWHTADGRTLPYVSGGDGDTPPTEVDIPQDVSTLDDDALATALASVTAELDALGDKARTAPETVTPDDAARAAVLSAAKADLEAQATERANAHQANIDSILDATGAQASDQEAEGEGEEEAPAEETPAEETPAEGAEEAQAPAEAVPVAASARPALKVPAVPKKGTINPSLRGIQARAPQINDAHAAPPEGSRDRVAITAAVGFGGFNAGQDLVSREALADAMQERARGLAVSHGNGQPASVASVRRDYAETLEWDSAPEDVDAAFDRILAAAGMPTTYSTFAQMAALTAAGGWCAPSEIDYSFFNVAQVSGAIDAPTVGINRGGLRWPFSLDLADFFGLSGAPPSGTPSNATMPWEWTELDDQVAATGTTPRKVCLRPPCPTFDEQRLRAFGICVTSGNLTDEAYPELIRHFVGLTMVAHARVMNRRHIAQMVANASVTSITPTLGASSSAFTHALGAAELESTWLRYKYGAPMGAVVEEVFPSWIHGVWRSDIAKRNGWDDLSIADQFMADAFDRRGVRVQFVEDWQSVPGSTAPANTMGAASPPSTWPSTVDSLMFFPGHFFIGRGLNINLGVIRDSVLNATNDHTAAWSEEGTLVGARGPEALKITHSSLAANGTSAATASGNGGA